MWAERFDGDTSGLFALQDEITTRIASALGVELITAEAARSTQHSDALDYILRGRTLLFKPRTPDIYREAIDLFERALALDPRSVEAQSRLAFALATRTLDLMTNSAATDLARAEGLVDTALAAWPRYALAHYAKGNVLLAQNRWDEAIPEYQAALAANRNLVARTKRSWLGQTLCRVDRGGDPARGTSHPPQPC
jgi:hypothetical protein